MWSEFARQRPDVTGRSVRDVERFEVVGFRFDLDMESSTIGFHVAAFEAVCRGVWLVRYNPLSALLRGGLRFGRALRLGLRPLDQDLVFAGWSAAAQVVDCQGEIPLLVSPTHRDQRGRGPGCRLGILALEND